MKRIVCLALFTMMLLCLAALGETETPCALCGGGSVCNTCSGNGYLTVKQYGTNEMVQIACTAGCFDGACPVCAPVCAFCGGDRMCDTCFGMGYTLMTVHGSNEPIQIACEAMCNMGVCPECVVECEACLSDGLCDTCLGFGYTTAKAYKSEELVKLACTGENCMQGFCAVCMPEIEDRFALPADPTPAPTIEPTPKPTPSPEPTRTPKPTPTPKPVGQAVFGKGTQIADLSLYTGGEFRLESSTSSLAYDFYSFEPTSKFNGRLHDVAEEYVNDLIDSGYYKLMKVNYSASYMKNKWFLEYVGPEKIMDAEDAEIYLPGTGNSKCADLRIIYLDKDNAICFNVNPDIEVIK